MDPNSKPLHVGSKAVVRTLRKPTSCNCSPRPSQAKQGVATQMETIAAVSTELQEGASCYSLDIAAGPLVDLCP